MGLMYKKQTVDLSALLHTAQALRRFQLRCVVLFQALLDELDVVERSCARLDFTSHKSAATWQPFRHV